jgi:hypothetical protein
MISTNKSKRNNLKLLFFTIVLFSSATLLRAQVGVGTTTPDASSVLDVSSTTAGLLAPRMTQAQKNAIAAPATGLFIYQTDATAGFYYYSGTAWTSFGSSGWGITGNTGTAPATNFLGTTDAQDLVIKTNNTETIRILSDGSVGIGTTAPTTKLHIVSNAIGSILLSDGFEDNTLPPFATSGAGGNWTVTAVVGEFNTGSFGAKSSGGIDSSTSDLTYTTAAIPAAGAFVSFALKTSSESGFDELIFYIDGTEQTRWSGLTAWTTVSYSLTAGVHALKWTYEKDGSVNSNDDRVYIDDVLVQTSNGAGLRVVDGNQASGKVLTSDASGNATWQTASSTYTFTNGLANTAGTVKLGGTLSENTTVGATAFDFNVSSASKANMLQVDSDENVVKFGHDTPPTDDGTGITIDGVSVTVDYMTSAKNGNSNGTTIGVGSIEYITDGEACIATSDSFMPITTGLDLGSASSRWNTLYSVNVVNVSDAKLKKNINPLNYGLKELMKLKPVSYKWKDNKKGSTIISENLQETKIGFLAQDLLEVLPEVVKTHDWKITDEKTKTYQYKENEVMGVMYSDIIPVTVKAIQEQQAEIEALKKTSEELKKAVEELKKQNELLLRLINGK